MQALFALERARSTGSREIEAGLAAATAIGALANAPEAVQQLVDARQAEFKQQFDDPNIPIPDQAVAAETIQQYANMCLPNDIQSEVAAAVANAQYKPVDYGNKPVIAFTKTGAVTPGQTAAKKAEFIDLMNRLSVEHTDAAMASPVGMVNNVSTTGRVGVPAIVQTKPHANLGS